MNDKVAWQREKRRRFMETHGFSLSAHYATGGQRQRILERDNYCCIDCGMTDEEHKQKWNRPITIDHINKDRSNNSDENLATRCLSCHGRKDLIPRLRERKVEKHELIIRAARRGRTPYQHIADALGFSIAGIYKFCKQRGIQ